MVSRLSPREIGFEPAHSSFRAIMSPWRARPSSAESTVKLSAIVALLSIALLEAGQFREAGRIEPMQDDRLVLAAVLEHTILPAHRRSNSGVSPPLALVSQSTPLCKQRPAGQAGCRIPEHWRQLLEPDAARKSAGLVGDERTLRELVQSLEARNAESQSLPVVMPPDVVLFGGDPGTTGSSSLSLPGYSTDRHALVYGS